MILSHLSCLDLASPARGRTRGSLHPQLVCRRTSPLAGKDCSYNISNIMNAFAGAGGSAGGGLRDGAAMVPGEGQGVSQGAPRTRAIPAGARQLPGSRRGAAPPLHHPQAQLLHQHVGDWRQGVRTLCSATPSLSYLCIFHVSSTSWRSVSLVHIERVLRACMHQQRAVQAGRSNCVTQPCQIVLLPSVVLIMGHF